MTEQKKPSKFQFEEQIDEPNVDFQEDNLENGFDDGDDFDDEEEKVPPLVLAGIFLGLVVLAAIICGVLWSFTHKDKAKEQLVNTTETIQDISGETESQAKEALINEPQVSEGADEEGTETVAGGAEDGEELQQSVNEPDSGNQEATDGEQVGDTVAEDAGQEPVSGNEAMEFTEVSDTVTAKDVTNLRSVPSTLDAENVVAQLLNGETLGRTGVNESTGWSRLDYNGQTVYAVTGYLTTDLTYKPPVAAANPNRITTQDGRVIIFTDCDDYITPKEYVNLRVEPSTAQGEATAKCQISNGTVVHRTGYSPDSGWSRVEYNGEILYVVSSMVYNTDAVAE